MKISFADVGKQKLTYGGHPSLFPRGLPAREILKLIRLPPRSPLRPAVSAPSPPPTRPSSGISCGPACRDPVYYYSQVAPRASPAFVAATCLLPPSGAKVILRCAASTSTFNLAHLNLTQESHFI